MVLHCSECGIALGAEVNNLASHLRNVHHVSLTGIQKSGFRCGQEGCARSFHKFTSLRRHLRQWHVSDLSNTDIETLHVPVLHPDNIEPFMSSDEDDHDNGILGQNSTDSGCYRERFSCAVAKMVAQLRANSNFTGAGLSRSLSACESLLTDVFSLLKSECRQLLSQKGISEEDKDFQELFAQLEVPDVFQGMHTIDGQITALKQHYKFVDSIEIPLGYLINQVRNRSSQEWEVKQVMETFQYVPIVETLKLVMSHKSVREYVENETCSSDGYFQNFRDGSSFQKSPYFKKYPQALRVQLYFDDIVVNNPLGSKVHSHKLGAFYFTIQNLPSHLQCFQSSIHVLAICASADIDKYGMNKILIPFVEDMKRLESVTGVPCLFGDEPYVLRATLAAVCADTQAAHQLFGLKGPAANLFCRSCMITRDELLNGALGPFEKWTKRLHERHLEMIKDNEAMETMTGVKEETALNQLNFHFTETCIFDLLHDVLEGVGEMVLFHVTKHMITNRVYDLTVHILNSRIHLFQYGSPEVKNKPSANFTNVLFQKEGHTLPQKGAQIWLLLRVFPFLVSDKVSEEDRYLELILVLNRINEILFAFKLKPSIAAYLHQLTQEFDALFRQLFPAVNAINKLHHLSHYAASLLESGPPRMLSCLRYEMRHLPLKDYGSKCCNYQNLPKTMVKMSQVSQCAWWGMPELPISKITCTNGQNKVVESCLSRDYLLAQGSSTDSKAFVSDCLKVWGIEYRCHLLVAIDSSIDSANGNPIFGCIKEIIVLPGEQVYFYCDEWTPDYFDPLLNAYAVSPDVGQRFVHAESLCDLKPFSLWNTYKNDLFFICLRHVLL